MKPKDLKALSDYITSYILLESRCCVILQNRIPTATSKMLAYGQCVILRFLRMLLKEIIKKIKIY